MLDTHTREQVEAREYIHVSIPLVEEQAQAPGLAQDSYIYIMNVILLCRT